jgi:2OG-Fe(II) oxygenase superfamily
VKPVSATHPPLSPILQALERPRLRSSKWPNSTNTKAGKAAKSSDSFCAEGHLPKDALTVSVNPLGLLASPLSPAAAQALHATSQPARHGLRDKTLLDKRVRDTGELPADTLALHWAEGACDALQAEVATALGLAQIEARLHNLLVYGPGQFFKPHQDTEKHPGMVATLVLVWPCPHIGGELVVRHGSEQAHFASQHLNADNIRWFAFYADCRHEVLPVAEGWRVALSFDLVLPPQEALPHLTPPPALLEAMREHFFPAAGPTLQPWVFLLDHEYTERGLHWLLLKGADRPRVMALRNAAEALGLTVHLALAEVHENWTAIPGGDGGRMRGRGHWHDDDDDHDDWHGDNNAQPDELIERGIVLNHWVDANDQQLRRKELPVADTDTASFSDTDESFLVNQEYEGYMGNYGHTLDYWYRRAALVVQTSAAEQAGRFISDFDAALADALALAQQGRSEELATRLQAATKALDAQRQQRGRAVFAAFSKLAAALPDSAEGVGQARALVEGFDWVIFTTTDARALAQLSGRRGEAWTADLINAWTQPADFWRKPCWRLDESTEADGAAPTAALPPGRSRWRPSWRRALPPS